MTLRAGHQHVDLRPRDLEIVAHTDMAVVHQFAHFFGIARLHRFRRL
jgi:hypothetical protein